jgi:hypothetical protein
MRVFVAAGTCVATDLPVSTCLRDGVQTDAA